jgi:4-diphosphocytidyl-2-C-methyl-D-erythritol kinase
VVTGRREDGYHTLDSVFLRLALHDHLEARPAADPRGPDVLLVSGDPSVPVGGNSVLRAVAALRRSTGRPLPALRIHLDKHIPAAAGLGGGSSDAAASLRLAMEVWGLAAVPPSSTLVAGLGADVPFFTSGHAAARANGIGELLEPLPPPAPAAGVLLVTPRERLATAAVFAALERDPGARDRVGLDRRHATIDALADRLRAGLGGRDLAALAPRLRDANALWGPATRLLPRLAALRDTLEDRIGQAVLLTGSGPTLVALYPLPEAAGESAASLAEGATGELEAATIIATSTSTGGPA